MVEPVSVGICIIATHLISSVVSTWGNYAQRNSNHELQRELEKGRQVAATKSQAENAKLQREMNAAARKHSEKMQRDSFNHTRAMQAANASLQKELQEKHDAFLAAQQAKQFKESERLQKEIIALQFENSQALQQQIYDQQQTQAANVAAWPLQLPPDIFINDLKKYYQGSLAPIQVIVADSLPSENFFGVSDLRPFYAKNFPTLSVNSSKVFCFSGSWANNQSNVGSATVMHMHQLLPEVPTVLLHPVIVNNSSLILNITYWGIDNNSEPVAQQLPAIDLNQLVQNILCKQADEVIALENELGIELGNDVNVAMRREELKLFKELAAKGIEAQKIAAALQKKYTFKLSGENNSKVIQERNAIIQKLLMATSAAMVDRYLLDTFNVTPRLPKICTQELNDSLSREIMREALNNYGESVILYSFDAPGKYARLVEAWQGTGNDDLAKHYAEKLIDCIEVLYDETPRKLAAPAHLEAFDYIAKIYPELAGRFEFPTLYIDRLSNHLSASQVGDTVSFGRQGELSLQWQVMERDQESLVLLCKNAVAELPYNIENVDSTWNDCSLRQWLNGEFAAHSFNDDEKKFLLQSTLENPDRQDFGVSGGPETVDVFYLPSLPEMGRWQATAKAFAECKIGRRRGPIWKRQATAKAFAGCKTLQGKSGSWWLRTPGVGARFSSLVDESGHYGGNTGEQVIKPHQVRPAVKVRLMPAETALLHESQVTTPLSKILAPFKASKAGDYIQFGRYPQNNGDTPEPIDWLVLAREDKSLLVVSKYGLDCKKYHEPGGSVTWEQCTLRKWLNSDFMNAAFSDDEQAALQVSHLRNANNPEYGANGGNDTDDKLFLLSIDEAGQYLAHGSSQKGASSDSGYKCYEYSNNSDLKVVATSYAVGNGASKGSNGNSWFWLRSPGYGTNLAARVSNDGDVYVCGSSVSYGRNAVRPALRIILPSTNATKHTSHDTTQIAHVNSGSLVASSVASTSSLQANNSTDLSKYAFCRPGDYIQFGRYPQNNGDTSEPIDWLVLAREGDSLLVISKYALDCKPYNQERTSVTWEQCTLRKWLNIEFMNTAFSQDEQVAIEVSHLRNADNPEFGTNGGNDTDDKLFLLSIDEAGLYLAHGSSHDMGGACGFYHYKYSHNSDLKVVATSYTLGRGAYKNKDNGNCWFWLRSPGRSSATYVFDQGDVSLSGGDDVGSGRIAVRPALRIILPSTNEAKQTSQDTTKTAPVNSGSSAASNVAPSNKVSNSLDLSRFASCKAGDYIQFGLYPQNNGDTLEPIDWLVLAREGDSLLVISKYALDCKQYHAPGGSVTWEQCTLRKWLNSDFMNAAFSCDEQAVLQVSHLRNANNPEYGTNGGNDTDDKLFLLSIAEAGQYLGHGSSQKGASSDSGLKWYNYSNNNDLKVVSTRCALGHGAFKNKDNGNSFFWLRSPGDCCHGAAYVNHDGGVHVMGYNVRGDHGSVRPALRITLPSTNAMKQPSLDTTKTAPVNSGSSVASSVASTSLQANNSTDLSKYASCKAGDYIQFGRYPQNNVYTSEPIDWLVLAREGDSLLVISKYGLDCKQYHAPGGSVTWEQCTLRKWLNSDFMNAAFSKVDQAAIEVSHLRNAINPSYSTTGGNDTDDKLFLLSIDEAAQYLAPGSQRLNNSSWYEYSNNNNLKIVATSYAIGNGAYEDEDAGTSWFWLRSSGDFSFHAAYVNHDGDVHVMGYNVNAGCSSVRPALRIVLPSTNATKQTSHDANLPANVNSGTAVASNVASSNKASYSAYLFRFFSYCLGKLFQALDTIFNSTNLSRFSSCKAGDIIQFGRYPQNNGDIPEPIDWLVLARESNSLLVVSKYGLDCKRYNQERISVTWEQCTLRKWLNSDFMNAAFTDEEQADIELSHLRNANNPEYGTKGGNDTDDKLFLLSIDEVGQYSAHGSSHKCQTNAGCKWYKYSNNIDLKDGATSYAIGNGAVKASNGNSWFWLRSPGYDNYYAAHVSSYGFVNVDGCDVFKDVGSIRPALRIILSSTNVTNQGLYAANLPANVNSGTAVASNVASFNKASNSAYLFRFFSYCLGKLSQALEIIFNFADLSRFASCKSGDIIQFGRYPQNNGDIPEPIDWLVLAHEGKSLLVISKYGLDCKPYNQECTNVTWEQCTLRKWLNSKFMNAAFSDKEQTAIEVSHLRNVNNPGNGTKGGNDTEDKLFLLSIAEAGQYLAHGSQRCNYDRYYSYSNNSDLKVVSTSYAIGHGAYKADNGNSCFWLRSPGYNSHNAAYVSLDGDVYVDGYYVLYAYGSIRPALRLILPS